MTNPRSKNEALILIKQHEGFESSPYHCPAGKLTIGFGTNLEARGISMDEAEYIAKNDIDLISDQLNGQLSWFYLENEARQAALIDMAYNLGVAGLLNFKNMISAFESQDYERAANEAKDSRWYNQVGNRGRRIVEIIRTGTIAS